MAALKQYLLDTHILLWWFSREEKLNAKQRKVLRLAKGEPPLLVASISLWEIATLVSLKRVRLALPLRDWLEKATAAPLVQRIEISPSIANEVSTLPSTFHRDPADRILVATARVHNCTLISSDTHIIDSKLVPTI